MAEKPKHISVFSSISGVLLRLERFTWLVSLVVFLAFLTFGYRYILLPQYQQLIAARDDERVQLLTEQKARMETYITDVQEFIRRMERIEPDDREQLSHLFVTLPETIIFEQQLKQFFEKENIELNNLVLNTSNPASDASSVDGSSASREDGSLIDLRNLLEQDSEPTEEEPAETEPAPGLVETITTPYELQSLPVDVEFIADNYFIAKQVLARVESSLPLMDVMSISAVVGADGVTTMSLVIMISHVL